VGLLYKEKKKGGEPSTITAKGWAEREFNCGDAPNPQHAVEEKPGKGRGGKTASVGKEARSGSETGNVP